MRLPRPVLCVVILALTTSEDAPGQRITTESHSTRKGVAEVATREPRRYASPILRPEGRPGEGNACQSREPDEKSRGLQSRAVPLAGSRAKVFPDRANDENDSPGTRFVVTRRSSSG